MKIKLGVIFGGCSVEHEVSIITAVQAMNNMDGTKYEIIPIYISKQRSWYTGKMLMDIDVYKDFDSLKKYAKQVTLINKNGRFVLQTIKGLFHREIAELDIVFPIVHGSGVEDGSVVGYLNLLGVPYVGSNILGSALGQDKVIQKELLKHNGIKVPNYVWFYDNEYLSDTDLITNKINKLKYPVIIKPANLGSSIGITVIKSKEELDKGITEAIKYDNKVIVEEMVPNLMEVNCSVLGNYEYQETSVIDEMLTDNEFLTYADKYEGSGKGKFGAKTGVKTAGKMSASDRVIPARISSELAKEVEETAKEVFKILNLSGITRVDFLIDKKSNEIYVNEPNTIPGCLAFYLWTPKGKDYKTLLDEVVTLSIKEYKNSTRKISTFDTNILQSFNGVKGLKGAKNKLRG